MSSERFTSTNQLPTEHNLSQLNKSHSRHPIDGVVVGLGLGISSAITLAQDYYLLSGASLALTLYLLKNDLPNYLAQRKFKISNGTKEVKNNV